MGGLAAAKSTFPSSDSRRRRLTRNLREGGENYDRLVAAGKPKMVALIAVARKLLIILNAIVRDNRPWQIA